MTWLQEHWIALTLLGLYGLMLLRHAIEGRRETEGRTDFYVGGRSMGGVLIGLSFFATYSSTNSFVGFAGQAYSYGAAWLLLAPAVVIFCFASWLWIAPRLRAFTGEVDSVTLADYIGFRFESTPARTLAAVLVIFSSFLYMTAVFKGIGNLLEIFLDMPYILAIIIVFVVVMGYTAVGGFISVVKTDAVQGVVMVAAGILLFWGTVNAAGGLDALELVKAAPESAGLFRWDAAMPFPVLIGIVVAGTLKFIVDPRQLSRFYALADQRAVRRGLWVSTGAFLLVYSMILPIGLYAHAILGSGMPESDLIVPTLLGQADILPAFPAAVIVVAMLAAAMSSLDSVLLVMASTWERDVVSLFRKVSDERAVDETRRWVVVFAVITAIIAFNPPGSIVDLTAFSGSLYAACFFPAVVLGLYWKRGTGAAVIASFVSGVLVLVGWDWLPFGGLVHKVFPAMALSMFLYVVFSTRAPPLDAAARLDVRLSDS
jgi:SSS family transporter